MWRCLYKTSSKEAIKFSTNSAMKKADIQPIMHVDPSSDCSLLTAGDATSSDRSLLLQRLEFLEMENAELRKREDYLKMINTTLIEALGNKDTLREMLAKATHDRDPQESISMDHSNKMNSFKRKAKQRKIEVEELHRRSIDTIYEADLDPGFKRLNYEQEEHFCSKQKGFSKAKNQTMHSEKKQYIDVLNYRSSTPKVQNRLSQNLQSQNRKSVNSLMDPLQLHSSFSKREIHLSGSTKSDKSMLSNRLGKNVATALLCDLCGLSYSPLEFISHARDCQSANDLSDHELNKITDKSFEEDESSEEENGDLLESLEQEKNALLNQISKLKKNRQHDRRLERNLDQIVLVINNKKQINQKDIRSLLKERNCYDARNTYDTRTTSTARKR